MSCPVIKCFYVPFRALDLLKLDPVNGNLTVAIAQLHRKLDQLPQALEYLNQTEDICPDCYTVHHDKAKILQGIIIILYHDSAVTVNWECIV